MFKKPIFFAFVAAVTSWGCADGSAPSSAADDARAEDAFSSAQSSTVVPTPDLAAFARIHQDALRGDGLIDETEAGALSAFARRFGGRNERIVARLDALLANEPGLTDPARAAIERALSAERPDDVPLRNGVYEVELGGQDFLFDDTLYLVGTGRIDGDTAIASHSRGYAAKRDGVLFTRHGSLAPHYGTTATYEETERLRAQGPDAALDRAAAIAGIELDSYNTFGAIARDPNYYDPSSATPFWAGICQGWTHNALDNRLSALVDVAGDAGARGLWINGQWISRADLGNAMMGASYSFGIHDARTVDSFVKPRTLVLGLAQYVLRSGLGLRVDIWNDAHNDSGTYNPQIWNQPILGASVEVRDLASDVAAAVVDHAAADPSVWTPIPAAASARLVVATAVWGTEANDSWEGEPLYRDSEWNMYMVTDAAGKVLKGYMAYELTGIAGLPVVQSDGLPDYIAYPKHEMTDAAFEAAPHRLLVPSNPEGVRFRFLVGTVLARGVPDPTRRAFEAEALSGTADPADLRRRFPGVANAYSPDVWTTVFEPLVGPAVDFGAAWAAPR